MPGLLLTPETWARLAVPALAALVGWATARLAIALTFRPFEFRGVGRSAGWQGTVPKHAARIAGELYDRTITQLGSVSTVLSTMDPAVIAEHVAGVVDKRLRAYTDEVMFYSHPALWNLLPRMIKEMVYTRVRAEMPGLIRALLDEGAAQADDLLDLRSMFVERLVNEKPLLVRLLRESAGRELRAAVLVATVFGFLLGVAQLAAHLAYPAAWVLPAGGAVVGAAASPLALGVLVRKGRAIGRRREMARTFARIVTTEVLTLQHVVYAMLYGPRAERAKDLIKRHVQPIVDELAQAYGPVAGLAVSEKGLEAIRSTVGAKAVGVSTDPFDHWSFNRDRSLVVQQGLQDRLDELPADQFEHLLRPCFEQGRLFPVLLGGLIGAAVGALEALVF